jgi:hypothetical protein
VTLVQPDPPLADEADRVYWEAQRFLECIAIAADEDHLDIALPESQYIDIGDDEVHDCPAVTVMIRNLQPGIPHATPDGIGRFDMHNLPMWTLNMQCDIVRCAAKPSSKGTVPTSDLNAQTQQASRDAAVLREAVGIRVGDFFGEISANITFLSPLGMNYATRLIIGLALH